MDKHYQIITVNHTKLPSIMESYKFLHDMSNRHTNFIPHKVDKPLIIYGAGNLGKMAKEYFDILNITISLITDKHPEQYINDTFWNNIKIISPEDVPYEQRKSSLLAICIVTSSFSEINKSLKEQGWNDTIPFYDISQSYTNIHPLNNGWYEKLTKDDISNIENILSKLEDNISRAHYLQFIAWHTLREEWIFKDAPIIADNRYFIPEVLSVLNDREVFVDIGAHHGEVILKFLKITNNKYSKIWAFEPDKINISNLYNNYKDSKYHINIEQTALGNLPRLEKKKFYSSGYSSQISDLGKTEVNVEELDIFHIPSTFIKIHTEGYELPILYGALRTITKNRPILAVTIYHSKEGLWKIPYHLITILDNYIFYFRLHSWYGTGAVIYAIPNERINPYE